MIFKNQLFKIIKPIWYFSLNSEKNKIYWVDFKKKDFKNINLYDKTDQYESEKIFKYDIAYQLWHKGYIDSEGSFSMENNQEDEYSINDQYLFLRRMFNPIWFYYTIIIRILVFKFSLEDFKAIIKSKNIKKISIDTPYYKYSNYSKFKSQLIKKNPLITIIIPTLNRYSDLLNALKDLEKQIYKNFEVLIVDQSDSFNPKFYDSFKLKIKLFHQLDRGLWKARNKAIKESSSEYLLFFDDDSRVNSNWIIEHLKCLDFFKADVSSGVSISKVGASVPSHYEYFRWADQLDTGNVLIKKNVFIQCGLFDLQFEGMRMGDGEFGLRVYLKGLKNISNPFAKRIHLKTSVGGLREIGSWDGFRPNNWFSPKPIPSVLYFYRKYWGDKSALLYMLKILPISLSPYSLKGTKMGTLLSLLLFFSTFPILIFQVHKSWTISKKMLDQGDLIESFN